MLSPSDCELVLGTVYPAVPQLYCCRSCNDCTVVHCRTVFCWPILQRPVLHLCGRLNYGAFAEGTLLWS